MERRFQTNYHRAEFEGEVNHGISMTKPSKSLSLREIIDRDLGGMLSPAPDVVPFYDENILLPDFKRMDMVAIDNWKKAMNDDFTRLKSEIDEEIKERKRVEKERLEKSKTELPPKSDNDGSPPK